MNIKQLYERLRPDEWRKEHRLAADIEVVNDVLFHPYATNSNRIEQVANWLQHYQSCIFGRVAAAQGRLYICVLTDSDFLSYSEKQLTEKIQDHLLDWKRRSILPEPQRSSPAHGFVLVASSPRISLASPDENLKAFAAKLLELWGCPKTVEPQGTMHWETLYLRDPDDHSHCARFTFSVDFFASAGDGRWWQDHRCPGGLLFTANSVGHMRKYREWYEKKQRQQEWVLQSAMLTIDRAADVPGHGRAMWLRDLGPRGTPFIADVACPFSPDGLKPELIHKDWTRYGGFVHSDHSIRPEFFLSQGAEAASEVVAREYLQDFTYLYDGHSNDYMKFIAGETPAQDEVNGELGSEETWVTLSSATPQRDGKRPAIRPKAALVDEDHRERARLDALLQEGRGWRMSAAELEPLL